MIRISRDLINQLIEWTNEEKPNEASGYLFKDNTIFCRIITDNKSRTHFMDNNLENLLGFIEEYGKPSAIFHSHPCEARPSGMDYQYMTTTIPFWNCIWLIMSSSMRLRAWTLKSWIEKNYSAELAQWIYIDHGYSIEELKVQIIE